MLGKLGQAMMALGAVLAAGGFNGRYQGVGPEYRDEADFLIGLGLMVLVAGALVWILVRESDKGLSIRQGKQSVASLRQQGGQTIGVQNVATQHVHGAQSNPTSTVAPELRQLIRATPRDGENIRPLGQGMTTWEVDAFIDVTPIDRDTPLRTCRIKLVELLHRNSWTERKTGEIHVSWTRDSFYQGQTYFFCWSGRSEHVEAVDIFTSERATIAVCIDTDCRWTTTLGAFGHLFHGDQYRLTLEISAGNSLPLIKDYWLQMRSLPNVRENDESVIEDWDARERP